METSQRPIVRRMSLPHIPDDHNDRQSDTTHNPSPSILDYYPSSSPKQPKHLNSQRMVEGFFGKAKKDRILKKKQSEAAFRKGDSASQVKTDDLSPDDIIIAVIGSTGSGKSSFINTITGLEIGVGHNLDSCTSEISTVRFSVPEVAYGDLVFVDTPGFDGTSKSDVDILKMIADWLKSTYGRGTVLSGLLYFHQITEHRMAGTPLKNLRFFEELCGKNALHNVVLVTTMWGVIDEGEGEARERELKSKYWRTMLARNSTISRFLWTRESAFTFIDPLIDTANRRISALLQQEMVDMSKQLPVTPAALELYSKMELLVKQRQELLDRIRNEMKRADHDKIALEALQKEHEKLQISLKATVNEMRELKLLLGKRLAKMTEKFFGIKFTFTFFKPRPSKDVPDDIIIALIGPTGSGKSSFISTITGLEIGVGHNLDSCTSEISIVKFSVPEVAYGDLVFVDTPGLGFDAEHMSHADVLKMIANWLKTTYRKDTLLSGVLYFHRITDNRADSIPGPLKNLHEFEELCGKNAFQNVILATTMWNETSDEEGEAQEQKLKSGCWEPMLDRGSKTSRFLLTRESAFALVDPFIEAANKRASVLLQQEMVDMRRHVPVTPRGHELYLKMEFLMRQRQELLDRIRNEITRTDGDNMALEPLQQEHEKLRIILEATVNEVRELKLPLGKGLVKMAEKFSSIKFTLTSMLSRPSKDESSILPTCIN